MEVLLLIGLIVVILFVVAFVTKRRFGVLGLALAAGYVLSQLWEHYIPHVVQFFGLDMVIVSPVTLVTIVIILLPSVALFFGGPVCRTTRGRLIGSLLYAVLAVIFCMGALEHTMVLSGSGKIAFDAVVDFRPYILTLALMVSIVDVMHAHTIGAKKH